MQLCRVCGEYRSELMEEDETDKLLKPAQNANRSNEENIYFKTLLQDIACQVVLDLDLICLCSCISTQIKCA